MKKDAFKKPRQLSSYMSTLQISLFLCTLMLLNLDSPVLAQPAPDCLNRTESFKGAGTEGLSGDYLCFWENNGRLEVFGYPITKPAFDSSLDDHQNHEMQWFQRSRFEIRGQNQNGRANIYRAEIGKEMRSEALEVDPDFKSFDLEQDPFLSKDRQKIINGFPLRDPFLKYWELYNDGEKRFGLPISAERLEYNPDDNTYYRMQWFTYARLEYHPENTAPNEILGGLLGNELKNPKVGIKFLWKTGRRSTFLSQPNSIFVDGQGYIYVNDRSNGRISKYNPDLKLVNFWYMEGGSQAIAGVLRTDNSNSKDRIILYSLPPSGSKISKLLSSGEWQTVELKEKQTGKADSGAPNLGLAVDGQENLFILKQPTYVNSYLVWEYNSQGNFVDSFVPKENRPIQTAIAVCNSKIYIANTSANASTVSYKIYATSGSKAPLREDEVKPPANPTTKTRSLFSITVDPQENVYVGEYGRLVKFDVNGNQSDERGNVGRDSNQLYNPVALILDSKNNLYVADPANHRVGIFNQNRTYLAVEDEPYLQSDTGRLAAAQGLAVANNVVLVSDPGRGYILRYNAAGKFQNEWTASHVNQIALSPDGNTVYALNTSEGKITAYETLKGSPLTFKVDPGVKFTLPNALTVGADGSIYVADTGKQRIVKLSKEGKFMLEWGSKGTGELKFGGDNRDDILSGPYSITFEPKEGVLYVVDPSQHEYRIQKFDQNGKPLGKFVTPSQVEAQGIAAPPLPQTLSKSGTKANDGIYILTNQGIYKFDLQNLASPQQYIAMALRTRTKEGSAVEGDGGDGNVSRLINLAVDEEGNIFTTDSYSRLQKFRLNSYLLD